MSLFTSQAVLAARSNLALNAKGADAFKSTTNPILDLFTETRKIVPETLDEFTILVRKIEAARNYDSEMFIKLLKFHRLIEKGNGIKGMYYICMMVLKDEKSDIYGQVLDWSRQYPKDVLRLARLSSMFVGKLPETGPAVSLKMGLKYKSPLGGKVTLNKKMTKWALTEKASGNITTSGSKSSPIQTVYISAEIELYSQLVADVIKKILTGKLYDPDVNLMLFKYLSYETGHFAVESKLIWTRVQAILEHDPVVQASKDVFTSLQSTETV